MPFNWQDIGYGGTEKVSHIDRTLFPWAGVYEIYHYVSMAYTAQDAAVFLARVNKIDTGAQKIFSRIICYYFLFLVIVFHFVF